MPRVKRYKTTPLAKALRDNFGWSKPQRQAKHRTAIKRRKARGK